MKYLNALLFICLFVLTACQKETDIQLPLEKKTLENIEYSKSELETIFNSSKVEDAKLELANPCYTTVTIANIQEVNTQKGYWKIRIRSNSWWAETYYEFTEEGVYHIALPSNVSLSVAFSANLYDWDCENKFVEKESHLSICDYTVTADISFSSDFEQFSETFEAYTSPNYSCGMSYGMLTGDCGASDQKYQMSFVD